jgi:hypothetical protein
MLAVKVRPMDRSRRCPELGPLITTGLCFIGIYSLKRLCARSPSISTREETDAFWLAPLGTVRL